MDGISKVIRTTRDIVRYVNILALTYPVVRDEINPVDFLGVECLRIFAPELYSFVVANPVILTGEADERSETMQAVASGMTYAEAKDVRSFRKAQYTTFLEQVPVQRREGIHGIMARLFPRWEATFQSKDVYGVIEQWRRDRRICHPDFFSLYFRLSLPTGALSEREMRRILASVSDPEELGAQLLALAGARRSDGMTRFRSFLESLPDHESGIVSEHIAGYLQALLHVSDDLLRLTEESDAVTFALPNENLLFYWVRKLLQLIPFGTERVTLLKSQLRYAKSVSFGTCTTFLLGRELGKYGTDERQEVEDRLFTGDELLELEHAALENLRSSVVDGRLINAPNLRLVFELLSRWASEQESLAAVELIAQSDEGLVRIVAAHLNRSFVSRGNNSVTEIEYKFNRDGLANLLKGNLQASMARCEAIHTAALPWITEFQAIALKQLLEGERREE